MVSREPINAVYTNPAGVQRVFRVDPVERENGMTGPPVKAVADGYALRLEGYADGIAAYRLA